MSSGLNGLKRRLRDGGLKLERFIYKALSDIYNTKGKVLQGSMGRREGHNTHATLLLTPRHSHPQDPGRKTRIGPGKSKYKKQAIKTTRDHKGRIKTELY